MVPRCILSIQTLFAGKVDLSLHFTSALKLIRDCNTMHTNRRARAKLGATAKPFTFINLNQRTRPLLPPIPAPGSLYQKVTNTTQPMTISH